MKHMHFSTKDNWTHAVASQIGKILTHDILTRDKATIAVPGGRTATEVLPILSRLDLNWSHITFTLTDERWVSTTHTDSNENLARTLLDPVLKYADFVGLKTTNSSPNDGLAEATARIRPLLPLSCVFLGMGEDGHIASLFPGIPVEDTPLQTTARLDHPRISMTPRTILNARAVVLAVSGAEKRAVIDRAIKPSSADELPVRYVLHQNQTPVSLFTS